jgi:hypothetical protein
VNEAGDWNGLLEHDGNGYLFAVLGAGSTADLAVEHDFELGGFHVVEKSGHQSACGCLAGVVAIFLMPELYASMVRFEAFGFSMS